MTSKINHDGGQDQHRYNIHNLLQTPQQQLQPQNFSIHPLPYSITEPYQPPKLESYHPPKFELTKLTATLDQSDSAAEDSRKLDTMCAVLKAMICQEGSSSASVHRFVEMFEKISWNQTQLEEALENFGKVSQPKESVEDSNPGLNFANQTQVAADSFSKSIKVEPSFEKGDLLTAGSFSQSNLAFNGYGKENVGADIFDQINNIEIVKKKPEPVEVLPKVLPTESGAKRKVQCTPRGGKRARRVCGTCSACVNRPTTPDCQACNNCLDQKRYGGPGKLKKACIKRLCVLVLKPHEQQQLNQNNPRSRSPPEAFEETSNSSTVSTASSGAPRTLQPVSQPQQQQSVSDFSSITTTSTGQMVLSAPAYNVDSGTVSFTFAPMVTGANGTPVFNIIPNISTSTAPVGNSGTCYAPALNATPMSMPSVTPISMPTMSTPMSIPSGAPPMSMPTMSMPSGPTMSMPVFATQGQGSPSQEQRVLDCREF